VRKVLLGAGLGAVVGAFLPRPPAPGITPAGEGSTPPARTQVIRHGASAAGACDDETVHEELVALRALASLLEAQVADLEHELYGEVPAWPADTPPAHQPAAFRENLAEALDACDVPVDLVDVRCAEPPCYALLRRDELNFSDSDPWIVALRDCAPWQAAYGDGLSLATDTVRCGDRAEGFTMLSASPDWLVDWEDEPERAAALAQRFDARLREARDGWPCRGE